MIFNKIAEKREVTNETEWTSWTKGEDYVGGNALNEQNYFSALNILSNTVAKLPILVKKNTDVGETETKDHYLWDLLRLRPNLNMNSFECIKSLMMMYKHYGMAGLYIDRNIKGQVIGLYPVRINQFTINNLGLIKGNNSIMVDFTCADTMGYCLDKDIIILRDNSLDGIHCKPTKSYIRDTLDTNLKSQAYQNELFANGLTNKAVVQMAGDIKEEKELKKVQEKFNRLYSSKGRIFTVPAGFSITPLNLNLVDSQFAQLKTIGKRDIATVMGIPFNLLENGSITEIENISYLSNTISPILTQLEQEFDYKLLGTDRQKGYKIRFNINAMLKTSAEQQKNIIVEYVKNGIYSLEYARNLLGVDCSFETETVTLPSGQILLKDLISGKASWQKDNGASADTTVKGGE